MDSREPNQDLGRRACQLVGHASLHAEPVLDADCRNTASALILHAGEHLDTARVGERLNRHYESAGQGRCLEYLEAGGQAIWMACASLVFRGVVTALDQTAAALYRMLVGAPPWKGHEFDLESWFRRDRSLVAAVPAEFEAWLRDTRGAATWSDCVRMRHALTHKTFPRHYHLRVGSGPPVMEPVRIDFAGGQMRVGEAEKDALDFGQERFRTFCVLTTSRYGSAP